MTKLNTRQTLCSKAGRHWLILSLLAALLWLPVEIPAARSPLEMDIKPGVPTTQVKYRKLAINDVFKFFLENYRINLHKTMLLVAAPDDQSYANALMKDLRMTNDKAQEAAKISAGMATESKDYYILALKVRPSEPIPSILRTTCHEMVHWYQYKEGGQQKTGQHKWIAEGVATVLACYIVDAHQNGEFNRYRQRCLMTMKQASQIPTFEALDTRKDWQAAMGKYGGGVVYSKAELAVMELAERHGIKSLFEYFRHLKHQTPEKAFRIVFKVNIKEFEKEMDQKFSKS